MKKKKNKRGNSYNLNANLNIILEISLTATLSLILSCFVLFKMPFGGAITLGSGSPIVILSLKRGAKAGIICGVIYGVLQMLLGFHFPPIKNIFSFLLVIFLDYLIPYSALGLASIFYKKINGKKSKCENINSENINNKNTNSKNLKYDFSVVFSSISVCLIRYISSVFSGIIVWGGLVPKNFNIFMYSVLYNLTYMLPETIIITIICSVVCKNRKFIK